MVEERGGGGGCMSAKDINGSHIFTPTYLRLNSFTQRGKVLHAPALSETFTHLQLEKVRRNLI